MLNRRTDLANARNVAQTNLEESQKQDAPPDSRDTPMCYYCSTSPQAAETFPYCSLRCAICAEND